MRISDWSSDVCSSDLAKAAEETFVAEGYGVSRADVMYNDFVIVGPAADPAGAAGSSDVTASLAKIKEAAAPFASRGDDSGTHTAELRPWTAAGIAPQQFSGGWYRETAIGRASGRERLVPYV